MLQIRQFQEERVRWESERQELEGRQEQLTLEKQEAEQRLAKLAEEVEKLRAAKVAPGASPPRPAPAEHGRSYHEQYLGNGLLQEQARAKAVGIDSTSSTELGSSRGSGDREAMRDQLLETKQSLERKDKQLAKLEGETLRLREELNGEKQKVLDLKSAAHKRSAAWKQELDNIAEELAAKQRLEEEVAQLRAEVAHRRQEMGRLAEREVAHKRAAERLQLEAVAASDKVAEKDKEMEILSSVVGSQLVAVEQELTQQVHGRSQLLELFLQHSLAPLTSLRRSCRRLIGAGRVGEQAKAKEVPPLYEPDAEKLESNLVKIVNLLRFSAEVIEASEQVREPARPVSERGNPSGSSSRGLEDTVEFTRDWLRSVLA